MADEEHVEIHVQATGRLGDERDVDQGMISINMNLTLDPATVKEFRTAFNVFDESGDGSLQADELATILASMGSNNTKEEIAKMIDEVDEDGSGQIEFEEFLPLMASRMISGSNTLEDFGQAFQIFDRDGSGKIEAKELQFVMANYGIEVEYEDAEELCRMGDFDGNGNFDQHDFMCFLEQMASVGLN